MDFRLFIYILVSCCMLDIICIEVVPSCNIHQGACEIFLNLGEHDIPEFSVNTNKHSQADHEFDINGGENEGSYHNEREHRIPQTADGLYKRAFLFNDSLPGPPIVVYAGQQLIVHVKNELQEEGTTVHWHGVTQYKTPWMDGVEGLSQCIINPGETFTYRFQATDPGTFWYHSHCSTQRSMGAHGPLIILERSLHEENQMRGEDILPPMEKEFIMTVSDWFQKPSKEIQEIVHFKAISYFTGWDSPITECFNSTKAPDGLDAGVLPFQSGLINGKGYHYSSPEREPKSTNLPLQDFVVEKGKKYRFRMIGTAMAFLFRVSIDRHKLHVISTDGNHVVTRTVDSIIIASGERYDFWIETDDPDDLGLYWIRAETFEKYDSQYNDIVPSHTEAVLRYTTSQPKERPLSLPRPCTRETPCEVLNCPFKHYTTDGTTKCLPITELQSVTAQPSIEAKTPSESNFVEHFLNFHMALEYTPDLDLEDLWSVTVNGYRNQLYALPPQIYPDQEQQDRVPCDCPIHVVCPCNHVIELPLGSTVQLVFLVTVKNPEGILNGLPHNIHLHGQEFEVLKMAYPDYEPETGFYRDRNKDIECFGRYCNKARWSNASWAFGNVPDTVPRPIKKDTIAVPIGGYAVVRFEANNPGFWLMHCHTEFHNEEGMSLVLKVGENFEMPPLPSGTTRCDNNQLLGGSTRDRRGVLEADNSFTGSTTHCEEKRQRFEMIAALLFTIMVILIVVICFMAIKNCRHSTYFRIRASRSY